MSSIPTRSTATKVVVASTVMLSFISFWRAAAIVLNDLASSVFYVGGIAEQAIGRSAPWFILGVMLFSFAVRSDLHGKLQHVRARRRLRRRARCHGTVRGAAFRLRASVRLHPDGADQQRQRRPVSRAPPQ